MTFIHRDDQEKIFTPIQLSYRVRAESPSPYPAAALNAMTPPLSSWGNAFSATENTSSTGDTSSSKFPKNWKAGVNRWSFLDPERRIHGSHKDYIKLMGEAQQQPLPATIFSERPHFPGLTNQLVIDSFIFPHTCTLLNLQPESFFHRRRPA